MKRTRLKRLLLTVTVALLVATAGCSGLTGDDGTDGNGDGASGSGYDVSGADLDGETLTNATSDAVESAGSYTLETNSTLSATRSGQQQTSASETTRQVDLDDDRGIRNRTERVDLGSGPQERVTAVYTDGNASYRKQTAQGQTTYDRQNGSSGVGSIRPVNTDEFAQNYTGIVDGFSWNVTGESELDGVAVTEYSLTGAPDKDTLGLGENTTIEESSGTLYIDSDGVVRQANIAYTVATGQGTTSIDATTTLSDIGSTSVEEPGWLSEAN